MKQYQKIYILYLEAKLIVSSSIIQHDLCNFSGIHRQQASKYFQIWQAISDIPTYDKNKKVWVKAKYSKSKIFRTKKEAQQYIDMFDFIVDLADKKIKNNDDLLDEIWRKSAK